MQLVLVYVKDTKHHQHTIHYDIQQDRKDVITVLVFLLLVILDVFVAIHNYEQKHITEKDECEYINLLPCKFIKNPP